MKDTQILDYLNSVHRADEIECDIINCPHDTHQEGDQEAKRKQYERVIEVRNQMKDGRLTSLSQLSDVEDIDSTLLEDLKYTFKNKVFFGSSHLRYLNKIINLSPIFEVTVFACILAENCLKFPITKTSELEPLFDQPLPEKIKKYGYSLSLARKFIPKELYPIVDMDDFFGKILSALKWGEECHHKEREQNK